MKKQKGAVLLITMVVLSLLGLISLMNMNTIVTSSRMVFNYNMHTIASSLAEGAIAHAVRDMKANDIQVDSSADWYYTKSGTAENGGTYSYTMEKTQYDDIYMLTGTGTMMDQYQAVSSVIVKYIPGKDFNPNNGWGNGDQDAPGNSLNNNNAENNQNGKAAPKGIQKKQQKENGNNQQQQEIYILSWL